MTWMRADGSKFDPGILRRRWERGRCVCCGGHLTRPVAIAEAVQICGRCDSDGHVRRPGELRDLLRVLAAPGGAS